MLHQRRGLPVLRIGPLQTLRECHRQRPHQVRVFAIGFFRAPPPRHDQTPGSGSSSAPRNLPAPQSSSATPSPTSPPAPSPAEKSLSAPAAFPVRPIPRDRPAPVHAALPLVLKTPAPAAESLDDPTSG